jgi:hypothetical protein
MSSTIPHPTPQYEHTLRTRDWCGGVCPAVTVLPAACFVSTIVFDGREDP